MIEMTPNEAKSISSIALKAFGDLRQADSVSCAESGAKSNNIGYILNGIHSITIHYTPHYGSN